MGVQTYLLDRRMVTLFVGDVEAAIGTARSFWKLTELDKERKAEIDVVRASLRIKEAPVAVMIAEVAELPLATFPSRGIAVHLVLGWDGDRASVTDFEWDYLPILGYAIKATHTIGYMLHEEIGGLLYPIGRSRALELGVLNGSGQLVRRGQPSIVECRTVKPYISSYAEANCLLSDGRTTKILTLIKPGNLPAPGWYIGKRPGDVATYPEGSVA